MTNKLFVQFAIVCVILILAGFLISTLKGKDDRTPFEATGVPDVNVHIRCTDYANTEMVEITNPKKYRHFPHIMDWVGADGVEMTMKNYSCRITKTPRAKK